MANKNPKRPIIYVCIAKLNRKCYIGGKQYEFKAGEEYKIRNIEAMRKLTDPLNGTLELVKEL